MIENINLNGATVSAELHGYMYTGIYGYHGVFDYGSNLSAEIVSNNEIKIKDGLLCNYGRFMRITGSESVSIANGKTGVKRTDLIVAHFESDGIKEKHDIRVIQGANGGNVPAFTESDIYDGGTVSELPLYKVNIDGLTITSVQPYFTKLISFDDLRNNISNPNLLINSNFGNPVNQRGQTSYTGNSIYTIDRWVISNNETLSLKDGYVRVSLNTAQPYLLLQQKVDIPKNSLPGSMTLSFMIRASKKSKMQLYDTNKYFEVGTDWTYISITFSQADIQSSSNALQDDHFRLYIGIKDYDAPNTNNLPSGTYFDISEAKLEAGFVATKFVARPYAEELMMCQRYYLKLNGAFALNGDDQHVNITVPGIGMRKNPSVKNPSMTATGFNGSTVVNDVTFTAIGSSTANAYGTILSYNVGTKKIGYGIAVLKNTELDAEIY